MGNLGRCNLRALLLCAALSVAAVGATTASAQTFRGTILGTVTDTSGAAILNAKVSALNVATGVERTTDTVGDGSYLIPELPVGTYKVTITLSGFQTSVTNGVVVDVATERRIDAVLKPGQVNQQVVVEGENLPQVDTTSNTLGGILTQDDIKDLPVNGRDYTKLIYLNPGVAGSPDQISDSPGSYGEFSMNGARGRSNNYLLDGTDMNDGYRNDPAINQAGVFGTPSAILPIDAVSELNVLSNFQPEYGRNGGAVVNIVTKSGTNQFHGDAFEYFRNDALDARNYFDPVGTPKAVFHNNQFGGSVGGPIVKDKTFFFADYEGQREGVGVVTLACVPGVTPAEASNSVIAALLARNPWPQPNIPGTGPNPTGNGCINGTPDASVVAPSFNNLSSVIAKIDHNFDQNNILTGRYFFGDSTQAFPLALTASGGQLPGFDTLTPTRVQLVSISYVHVFSPTKVNDVRYGWNRFAEGFFPQDRAFDPSTIGLCASSSAATCAGAGLPVISVSGFAQLGATASVPRHRYDSNNQLIDGFSWKINKHDLRFGFEFRRTTIQQFFDKSFRGQLKFDNITDFLSGTLNCGATASNCGLQYGGNSLRHTHQNSYGLYAQDSYRVTPRITLNYGLRWDYYGVIGEENNLFSNITSLDPVGQTFTLTQTGQPGLGKLYNPDYRNFSPRVSIAWDVFGTGKTVVRSGYGIFFDAFSQDLFLGQLPYPPTFDPGPAYNNIGPAPILPAKIVPGTVIGPGVPIFGAPNCASFECDAFAFDRNIKTPYMENYNLNIEQQLANRVVLQIGYVGSQGHRLFRYFDINQPSLAAINASDIATANATPGCVVAGVIVGGPGCITASYSVPRPFQNNPYGAFYVMQENSTGKSNYNSLQLSLRVNNYHGFTSIVNYVWSRSMDNSSDGFDFEPNAAQPNNSTNPNAEYGPSNFDVPQRFTWIAGYELPHMGGDWQKLKNGWGIDSTVTLQSGQPFQLNYNFEDDFSGSGEGDDRPDVVGPIRYDKQNPNNFLQLSSFALPCTITAAAQANPTGTAQDCLPGTRHFGNLGRDALRGPTFKQWDLAIYKNTRITERLGVQFRADFFNFLNHPNFANPFLPAFIADPVGNALVAAGNRETGSGAYHITATGDVGIGNPFLGGGGPRGIQLAAKFTF